MGTLKRVLPALVQHMPHPCRRNGASTTRGYGNDNISAQKRGNNEEDEADQKSAAVLMSDRYICEEKDKALALVLRWCWGGACGGPLEHVMKGLLQEGENAAKLVIDAL